MGASVGYEVTDGVALVTLARPEVKNAMSLEVFDLLRECGERAAADTRAGAVLVRGADGVFSSGIDVSVFAEASEAEVTEEFIRRLQDAFTVYEDTDKPTIAAIEGHCLGGGIQLAAACHVRAVAPSAQLAIMETRWGLVPDLGGTWRIPRLVGLGRATELALTARRVGADEALRVGLAEVALGGEDPQAEAFELAARLAAGPGAVRRLPRLLRESWGVGRGEGLRREREAQLANLAGPDVQEAMTARLEGREPRFVGE